MIQKLRQKLSTLPWWIKPVIPLAIVFGSIGCFNIGFWKVREAYLVGVLKIREQQVRTLLSEPKNYRDKLGGKLTTYRIRRNYSDAFATYTVFICEGELESQKVRFEAQIGFSPPLIRKTDD
jgi:hypothetical protein